MSCLCDQCSALCCRYFVLEIDTPETRRQYDDVRWYLVHENTFVFIEKKKWYLGVYARCKHLQLDNRCGIYETRPAICRSYSTDNCDYHGGEYNWEILFSSAEQLQKYGEEKLAEARAEAREKAKRRKVREARAVKSGGKVKVELPRPKKTVRKKAKKRARTNLLPALLMAGGLGAVGASVDRSPPRNGNGNGRGLALPVLAR